MLLEHDSRGRGDATSRTANNRTPSNPAVRAWAQLGHHVTAERGLQTRPAERTSASLLFCQVTLRAAQRSSQLFPGR